MVCIEKKIGYVSGMYFARKGMFETLVNLVILTRSAVILMRSVVIFFMKIVATFICTTVACTPLGPKFCLKTL